MNKNRVELNVHTKMSEMEGIDYIEDYIMKAKEVEINCLAITDNGVVQAFPDAQKFLERNKDNEFKIIYGMKAYLKKDDKSKQITILVQKQIGIKNLYKIVSESHLNYFDEIPLVNKELITKYREGLLIGTGNLDEIPNAFYDFFEVYPYEDMETVKNIVNLKDKLVVATSNTYYIEKEDKLARDVLLYNDGKEDDDIDLHFRTTEEMLKEFEYLGKDKAYEIVVENTNKIADMCEKVQPISKETCYPHFDNENEKITNLAHEGLKNIFKENEISAEYIKRLNKELESIIENKYSNIYLIAYELVKKSNEDEYVVGSRGGIGASLVAYCLGITNIDPIKYNIPFETFAGFNGDKEPDIDLNFADEYQAKAHKYMENIIREGKTFKPGTVGSIAEKTAFSYVKKYFEYRNIQFDEKEILRISEKCIGAKSQTGMHPRRNYNCSKR